MIFASGALITFLLNTSFVHYDNGTRRCHSSIEFDYQKVSALTMRYQLSALISGTLHYLKSSTVHSVLVFAALRPEHLHFEVRRRVLFWTHTEHLERARVANVRCLCPREASWPHLSFEQMRRTYWTILYSCTVLHIQSCSLNFELELVQWYSDWSLLAVQETREPPELWAECSFTRPPLFTALFTRLARANLICSFLPAVQFS